MNTRQAARPIAFAHADTGEETARADLYGLLAALYAAPPSAALLTTLATAPGGDGVGVLDAAWKEVTNAARAALADGAAAATERLRDEYERLFIGIGKPEVLLYGSFYLSGFLMEKPLAALRTDLMRLGLERADDVVESEDHIASLCEVMRYLIAADDETENGNATTADVPPLSDAARLARQKTFFATHLQPWTGDMCAALSSHRHAVFYRPLAHLTQVFFEVEAEAFDIGATA
jgi:TorA maturation chaperone TorD